MNSGTVTKIVDRCRHPVTDEPGLLHRGRQMTDGEDDLARRR